jgi:hypothetical protein
LHWHKCLIEHRKTTPDYFVILSDQFPAQCVSLARQVEECLRITYSLDAKRKTSDGRSRRRLGDGYRRSRNDDALAVAERSTTRGGTVLLGESQTREDDGEDSESELIEEHGCGCVWVGSGFVGYACSKGR